MNISGVLYNGNMKNAEWKSTEPSQGKGNQGSLTGSNLSEGKRLDSWEVTHVQNRKSALPTIDRNEPIKVVHIKHDHYLRSGEQYFEVFEQYAKGKISEDDFIAYSAAFEKIVGSTLKTDTKAISGINALVKEMKENIAKGVANTPNNLKTELSTGGIKLTWKELMNLQKTGEYID